MNTRHTTLLLPIHLLGLAAALLFSAGCTGELDSASADFAESTPDSNASEETQALTDRVVKLAEDYRQADPFERESLRAVLAEAAQLRFEQLKRLTEEKPIEVLAGALPNEQIDKMPPGIQLYMERRVRLRGRFGIYCDDGHDPHDSAQSRFVCHNVLRVGAQTLKLHFVTESNELAPESEIEVTGVQIGEYLVAGADGGTSTTTIGVPQSSASTEGEQSWLVLMANFLDDTSTPVTADQLRGRMTEAADWFQEASYGRMTMTFDVHQDYIQVPENRFDRCASCWTDSNGVEQCTYNFCNVSWLAPMAMDEAQNLGIDVDAYDRVAVYYTRGEGKGIGSGGYNGQAYLAGSTSVMSGDPQVGLITHEFGHNLGLYHSNAWECPVGTTLRHGECFSVQYGDHWDVMGRSSNKAHYNAYQKERIRWLNAPGAPSIQAVETSGEYIIDAMAAGDLGIPKALQIFMENDADGDAWLYYMEYRQGIEGTWDRRIAETTAGQTNVENGVVFHKAHSVNRADIDVLDMTPDVSSTNRGDADLADPALVVGETYDDAGAGLTFTTLAVGPEECPTPTEHNCARIGITIDGEPPPPVDTDPPTVLEVTSTAHTVTVRYSEPVDPITAVELSNYDLSGAAVAAAEMTAEDTVVLEPVAPLAAGPASVAIANVTDLAETPNTIAPGTEEFFSAPFVPIGAAVFWANGAVLVTFNGWLSEDTALDPANYQIDHGLSITRVEPWHDSSVTLYLSEPAVAGARYTVTVNNVQDQSDPPIVVPANSQVSTLTVVGVCSAQPGSISGAPQRLALHLLAFVALTAVLRRRRRHR